MAFTENDINYQNSTFYKLIPVFWRHLETDLEVADHMTKHV